jgi:hypothetical protein
MKPSLEEETRSNRTESLMSSDDSDRLSTDSTLADESEDSDRSDLRGGFMVPRKCDMARSASTML